MRRIGRALVKRDGGPRRAGRHAVTPALAVVGALAAAVACADADREAFVSPPVNEGDAGAFEPAEAGADEASAPDAAPRTCSDHGFCRTSLPPDETLRAVWGDGAGAAWAVSEQGDVLRWDGSTWKIHASDLGPLAAIWGSEPTDVWVGGRGGIFHGTGASADTLAFAPSPLPGAAARVISMWGASPSDLWAIATGEDAAGEPIAEVLHWTGAWQVDPASALGLAFTHVWGSAASGVWIGGARPIPDEGFDEMVVLRRKDGDTFAPVTLPEEDGAPFPFGVLSSIHGAAAVSDSLVWIYGRTTVGNPAIWKGSSTDSGATFTFEHIRDGRSTDPAFTALTATAPDEAWAVGEYGRVRRWNGVEWATAAVTTTKLPVLDPLYGVWSGGSAGVWVVGEQMALHYDPTKKDGGAR